MALLSLIGALARGYRLLAFSSYLGFGIKVTLIGLNGVFH